MKNTKSIAANMRAQRQERTSRAKAVGRKKSASSQTSLHNSPAKSSQLKKAHAQAQASHSGPRISRSRLRMLRDDLDRTKDAVSATVELFWITPEHDIRRILARTEHMIGRVADTLSRAA